MQGDDKLYWCRTCGRFVAKPVEKHERDPRYARFHAGAKTWDEALVPA